MPITNFPNGVSSFGLPVLGGGLPPSGNVFFVNSASSLFGPDGSYDQPLATLSQALSKCVAGRGDLIVLMPGHSETITGAGGITVSKNDVQIVGLGRGSRRPNFLMDGGTTVTAIISGAGVMLSNIVFTAGHSNVVCGIDVQAAGVHLDRLSFRNNTTNEDFVTPIKVTSTTNNTADGLRVTNCDWFTVDTDDREFIELNSNVDGIVVHGNFVRTSSATGAQLVACATGKLLTNALITWNYLQNAMTANELFLLNDGSTNSGIIAHNRCRHADVTATHDLGIDGLGCGLFDNLSASTDSVSGFVLPAIDANS